MVVQNSCFQTMAAACLDHYEFLCHGRIDSGACGSRRWWCMGVTVTVVLGGGGNRSGVLSLFFPCSILPFPFCLCFSFSFFHCCYFDEGDIVVVILLLPLMQLVLCFFTLWTFFLVFNLFLFRF